MKMYDKKLTLSHWEYEFKPVYKCVKRYENIIHKKEKPKCTKKPKKVCNSKWKLLPSGKKVKNALILRNFKYPKLISR